MYAYGHLALPHPEAQRTLVKIFEIAIKDKTCEYSKMHSKSRHPAIEEGNMATVTECDEQSMHPKYSHANARWKWPPNVLPP